MHTDQLLKPEIEELIQKKNLIGIREAISEWEPSEIATLIRDLPTDESILVFRVLPRDVASKTFEYLANEKQEELIEALARDKTRLTELLNDLSPDDRTALLEELPAEVAQRLIALLSPDERKITTMLLGYPEESIGRLMTTDYVAVRPHWTIQQAMEHIRRHGKDSETLNVIYVVDKDWRLVDDLRIRELLLADPETSITDLMDEKFVSLKAYDDQEKAVQLFRDYDRIALPVTDSRGILLGIVTVDDVLDVAEEETT
ncbi:MAG TPA: CBS domain-containing protein, partial [Balneolales bacterium]|nr:CBS domain-containing protein [Balneolales bacterium]